MDKAPVYWLSPLSGIDDFGRPYGTKPGSIMYDAATRHGPWANMSEESWLKERKFKKLGPGFGQKYQLQEDGRWLKVEG